MSRARMRAFTGVDSSSEGGQEDGMRQVTISSGADPSLVVEYDSVTPAAPVDPCYDSALLRERRRRKKEERKLRLSSLKQQWSGIWTSQSPQAIRQRERVDSRGGSVRARAQTEDRTPITEIPGVVGAMAMADPMLLSDIGLDPCVDGCCKLDLRFICDTTLGAALGECEVPERDQLRDLAREMFQDEGGVVMKDRKWMGMKYPSCFTGAEAMDWLLRNREGMTQTYASEHLRRMAYFGFIQSWSGGLTEVDDDGWYLYVEDGARQAYQNLSPADRENVVLHGVLEMHRTGTGFTPRYAILVGGSKAMLHLYSTSVEAKRRDRIILAAVASVVWSSLSTTDTFEVHTLGDEVYTFRCRNALLLQSWASSIMGIVVKLSSSDMKKLAQTNIMMRDASSSSAIETKETEEVVFRSKKSCRDCIVRSGQLYKKSGHLRILTSQWRKRIVNLIGSPYFSVQLYHKSDLTSAMDDIDLRTCKGARRAEGCKEHPYQFAIISASGTEHLFACSTKSDVEAWLKDLLNCITLYKDYRSANSKTNLLEEVADGEDTSEASTGTTNGGDVQSNGEHPEKEQDTVAEGDSEVKRKRKRRKKAQEHEQPANGDEDFVAETE